MPRRLARVALDLKTQALGLQAKRRGRRGNDESTCKSGRLPVAMQAVNCGTEASGLAVGLCSALRRKLQITHLFC